MSNQPVSSPSESAHAPHGATGRNIKYISEREAALKAVELSSKQLTAIDFLLRGYTDLQVAAEVGADRGTIYRWRHNRLFAEILGKLREQAWEQSTQQMRTLMQPALELLTRHMNGDNPKLALQAAGMLLRMASAAQLKSSRSIDASRKNRQEKLWDDFDAYINAPMPK
jgi:hypothetical protein